MQKIVCFGELLMRLSPPNHFRIAQTNTFDVQFGGAEYNVAASLAHFGLKPTFVSRIPNNKLGKRALAEVRRHGIDADSVVFGGDRLGIYFLEKGAIHRPSEIIYDRSGSSISEANIEAFDWNTIFKGAQWFHFTGISPAISQKAADLYLFAVQKAKESNIMVSCDINHRNSLWNYGKTAKEIMPRLLKYVDIVFGNEKDAAYLFDIPTPQDDIDLALVFKSMMGHLPNTKMIVSTKRKVFGASHNQLGAQMFNGTELIKSKTYDITPIVDRIGGGDAFVAGFIRGYLKYDNKQSALEFATAASCLKHSIPGDANYVSTEEVERLAFEESTSEVKR